MSMKDLNPEGARRLADNLIREAMERGAFDNLPGAGKPIPDIDQPYDPMWWLKKKLADEQTKLTREQARAIVEMDERRGRKP
jgi:hypothetical protein